MNRTRFLDANPIITVSDLARARAFYTDVLGFKLDFDAGDVLGLVRDDVLILLIDRASSNARQPAGSSNVSFLTSEIDRLYQACLTAGADIIVPPADRFYGQRDFAVRDPDGSALSFGCTMSNSAEPVTAIRPQYHLRRTAQGIDAFDVRRLIELSRDLPVRMIDPAEIDELDDNHWYFHTGSEPTPRSIVEHLRLTLAADLRQPIILDAQGRLMDGMHRVCRALFEGVERIPAVQFATDPAPDHPDCDPQSLPYGDG